MKTCRLTTIFKTVLAATFAALALSSCVTSHPLGEPVPLASGEPILASVRAASRPLVYEGLPHQIKERELMERESTRKDVTRFAGYPFYTPAVPARDPEALRRILGDPKTYGVYKGARTCGGFHPDYTVSWSSGGRTYHMLICFGCGEALFSDGTRYMPYDIKNGALPELRALLGRHAAKRPPASS